MPIKAIFFDLDDTLHDHQKPFADTFSNMFPNVGMDGIENVYKKYRYFSDLLWENYIRKEITLEELRIFRTVELLKSYEQEISNEMAKEFQLKYESALLSIELLPEVPELLIKLNHMGFELGIITNGPTEHQKNKIDSLSLTKYIPKDRIFISDEVGVAKPDPKIFHKAGQSLMFSPENYLYIGDSWTNDVIGAHNAGWHSIWFNHRKRNAETNHKPLKEIEKLNSIFSILDKHM